MSRNVRHLERVREVKEVELREREARAEGEVYGPRILQRPPSAWRGLMRSDASYRSYGTLQFLLEAARARFETEPTMARELTAAVVDFVDEVKEGPSHVHVIGLRGLARKEHANALEHSADLREALRFAERAIEIYDESPALHFDKTRAWLVAAHIYRDLGEPVRALEITRYCARMFADYEHKGLRSIARMCEGGILFKQRKFDDALKIFVAISEEAELNGDTVTLARCLNNAAECARELGDLVAARDLYPRALARFEKLNMPTEANRVRWGYALSLAAEGRTSTAVSELYKVRAVYLNLGANTDAACAALDIVRLRFNADEDVREICSELVTTLTASGLVQSAIEALAYLREQAKVGGITTRKIAQVRTFIGELARTPHLAFARPIEGEEG